MGYSVGKRPSLRSKESIASRCICINNAAKITLRCHAPLETPPSRLKTRRKGPTMHRPYMIDHRLRLLQKKVSLSMRPASPLCLLFETALTETTPLNAYDAREDDRRWSGMARKGGVRNGSAVGRPAQKRADVRQRLRRDMPEMLCKRAVWSLSVICF